MDYELQKWIDEHSFCMNYKHFDYKITLKDLIDEISSPSLVAKHSFKPFIHLEKKTIKYNKQNHRIEKIRNIYCSSHADRCIYQFYSHLLMQKYNILVKTLKINDVAIAYRDNLKKSNIHFAKSAFDFIKSHDDCVVIVSDFTNFFDTLDHDYLKKQLCKLLEVSQLPNDYYHIFKNITKFSFVNQSDIDNLIKSKVIPELPNIYMRMEELRKHKELIHFNHNSYGIPQGSTISAILSNIYMIDFDVACKNFLQSLGGMYLRYSDDSIFIFPNQSISQISILYNKILGLIQSVPGLNLSREKTKVFFYNDYKITNYSYLVDNYESHKNAIDYLGFTFDGKNVKIRDKTIGKYYYRAYSKADTIAKHNQKEESNNKYGCEKLYLLYTQKGSQYRKGNFITYVQQCEKIFGKEENMDHIINVHYGKIKKRLIK